jgi:O-antigen/teichoic acid export membrane protein
MSSDNNSRIAKNTLMLYARQILTLLVSLYTVRVVLEVLGVEDYGIYSVVGGIVSFFSFLSGTMASATQRFFSFALGQNDFEKLKRTFTVNWIIYGGLAVLALLLLETVGLWFVNEALQVPPERFEAAKWVFHFSVFTFIATIIRTPFMAIIIAHEDMHLYAYISILEVILKLAVVFLLVYLPWDKLEVYGALIFFVSVITSIAYFLISVYRYKECQFKTFYWDKGLLHEIVGFTSWTLFGQLSTVFRSHGITILLNQVFSPVVVAAKAISVNITSQINVFSNNFNIGLYPPIIKAYAAGDKPGMFSLIFNGSKITFFLMWILALPLFLEMEAVLNLWLMNPPGDAVLFTRLALVEVLVNSVSMPLITAARAPGKMRAYELTLGIIQLLIFIVAWIILKLGGAAHSVFIVAIFANVVMFIVRLFIVRGLISLNVGLFFYRVILPVVGVAIISAIPSYTVHYYMPEGFWFVGISLFSSVVFSTITMYFVGLDKKWRDKVWLIIGARINQMLP